MRLKKFSILLMPKYHLSFPFFFTHILDEREKKKCSSSFTSGAVRSAIPEPLEAYDQNADYHIVV
jgi:hypothetical protein